MIQEDIQDKGLCGLWSDYNRSTLIEYLIKDTAVQGILNDNLYCLRTRVDGNARFISLANKIRNILSGEITPNPATLAGLGYARRSKRRRQD